MRILVNDILIKILLSLSRHEHSLFCVGVAVVSNFIFNTGNKIKYILFYCNLY